MYTVPMQTYVISLHWSNLEAKVWTRNLEANVWVLFSIESYLPRSCSWQEVLAEHQGCGVVGGCGGGTAAPGAPGVPLGARQHTSLPRPTTLSIRVSWVLKYPRVSKSPGTFTVSTNNHGLPGSRCTVGYLFKPWMFEESVRPLSPITASRLFWDLYNFTGFQAWDV